jgi:DNA-binding IclR family transcriptional regulator
LVVASSARRIKDGIRLHECGMARALLAKLVEEDRTDRAEEDASDDHHDHARHLCMCMCARE